LTWVLVGRTAVAPLRATRSGRDDKFIAPERLNCRSLGYARDDKGEGRDSIWCDGINDSPTDLVHSSVNLPQASYLLGMTKGPVELPFGSIARLREPQVPALTRISGFAPVGMTMHLWYLHSLRSTFAWFISPSTAAGKFAARDDKKGRVALPFGVMDRWCLSYISLREFGSIG
jgi:hypothetical protein